MGVSLMVRITGLVVVVGVTVTVPASAQEECVQMPRGVVAWWPADGTMEDLIADHDAQDNGVLPVVFSPGRVGQAFDFAAFDTRLVVQHDAVLTFDATDEYSILFWMRTPRVNQPAGELTLVSKWGGGSLQPYPYAVRITPDPVPGTGTVWAATWDGAVTPNARTSRTYDDDNFHHIAAVFRHPEKTIEIYGDGTLDASESYTQDLSAIANGDPLYFGLRGNNFSSTDYDGLLDEIMIFRRALTACEIAEIHASGGEGICRGDGDGDGLADYEDNCPGVMNDLQTDTDADGVGNECDCAPFNPSHSVVPPEVCELTVGRNGGVSELSWTSLSDVAGDGVRYDVLSGLLHELPVGIGASEECVGNDLDAPETNDSFLPAPGQGVWYLVRAVSLCGQGSWGSTSSGFERISPACP